MNKILLLIALISSSLIANEKFPDTIEGTLAWLKHIDSNKYGAWKVDDITNAKTLNFTELWRKDKTTIQELHRLKHFQGLETLKLLRLSNEQFMHIASLKNLKHLSLWLTTIDDDGLSVLSELKLRSFKLGRNYQIKGSGFKYLANMETLEELDISYEDRLGDEALAHLSKLTKITKLKGFESSIKGATIGNLPSFEIIRNRA